MAKLDLLQCSGCGSPLAPGALVCEYCGNKNVIKSRRNPLKISADAAKQYIAFYANKTKENPKDTNALYAMGLLYLNLKNYELAQRNFQHAIDQSPLDADVYYYYALSLIAGRVVATLCATEINRIEQYLGTAIQMETKCKYLVLMAVIKEEYYITNHLVLQGTSPYALFEQAKEYTPDELDEITDHCILRGENTQYNIDLLLGGESEQDVDDDDDETEYNDLDEMELEEAYNLTEEQRKSYYDYRFFPIKPGYSSSLPYEVRLESKPSYISFFIGRAWKLVVNLVLSSIILGICQLAGWGFTDSEHPLSKESVEHIVQLKEAGKKLQSKQRTELIAQLHADSIETIQKDSILAATHIRLMSNVDKERGIEEVMWLKNSIGGYIWAFIIMLPLLIWLIMTFIRIGTRKEERAMTSLRNNRLRQQYIDAVEGYRTKPTDTQMELFIQNFLSEVVDMELEFHGKSGQELKGRTLFLNEYFDYREDGENYEDSAIEYQIVLLESDCVSIITSDWRIYEDISDTGTIVSISYSDIKEVCLTEETLSFGGITIKIPDQQVFEYQDDDPSDELTFSTTCTSDVRQFAVALRKLHIAYKSKY